MKQSWLHLAIATHSSSRFGQQYSVLHLCVSSASISVVKKTASGGFPVIKAARIGKAAGLNCKNWGSSARASVVSNADIQFVAIQVLFSS